MDNTNTLHNWSTADLVAKCKSLDNSNGDWDSVSESERGYLISVIAFHLNIN